MRLALKICGMREPHNITEVAALGPDYMGFIFYDRSLRYAGELSPRILRAIPDSVCKVGVFVDAPETYVADRIERYGLDMVQLHGNETVDLCRRIRRKCPVIKAFRLRNESDCNSLAEYADVCDYWLFDTPAEGFGGSGRRFDWSLLAGFESPLPFFLSGGIGPDDADRVRAFGHPALAAVDVNSRFETEPGVKDVPSLREFMRRMNLK